MIRGKIVESFPQSVELWVTRISVRLSTWWSTLVESPGKLRRRSVREYREKFVIQVPLVDRSREDSARQFLRVELYRERSVSQYQQRSVRMFRSSVKFNSTVGGFITVYFAINLKLTYDILSININMTWKIPYEYDSIKSFVASSSKTFLIDFEQIP